MNELSITDQTASFELVQRQAKMYSDSDLVPKEFRGKIGNCVIALEMAHRIGTNPLTTMQSLHVIHGKPGWSAQFLIACLNSSGRFSPLQYEEDEETAGGRTRAYATSKDTGQIVYGDWVSMEMAKAEGWSTKAGSKWLTMPSLMRRYRAAAFFVRTVAPEISLGMHTAEELRDMPPEREVNVAPSTTANPFAKKNNEPPQEAEVIDGGVGDEPATPTPTPVKKKTTRKTTKAKAATADTVKNDALAPVRGWVEAVDVHGGEDSKGKAWKRWDISFNPEKKDNDAIEVLSTFSSTVGGIAIEAEQSGDLCEAVIEESKDQFPNTLKSLEVAK